VLRSLRQAGAILLPPSNPFVSIGPILALPGVRALLQRRRARVAAVSPMVGGAPVKGPLHRMLRGLGHEVSPVAVAALYQDIASLFVLDKRDARLAPRIAALGMQPLVTDTLMTTPGRARHLAQAVLRVLDGSAPGRAKSRS
jgi:LPPG:FO 2-phospho-L-lactate transferase